MNHTGPEINGVVQKDLNNGSAAQMVDGHQTVNLAHRNAVGSNPTTPTKLIRIMELWCNWCARWTENPEVVVQIGGAPLKSRIDH